MAEALRSLFNVPEAEILKHAREELDKLPSGVKKARLTLQAETDRAEVRFAYRQSDEHPWMVGAAAVVRKGEKPQFGLFVEAVF